MSATGAGRRGPDSQGAAPGGLMFLTIAAAPCHRLWRVSSRSSCPPLQGAGDGVAGLAYSLGLRHAFDADHISAIDNTTRKLMSEGKRPLSIGFWFSLGHSTIVGRDPASPWWSPRKGRLTARSQPQTRASSSSAGSSGR